MLFNLSQKVNSNTIVRHHFACDGVAVHSGNCIMKLLFIIVTSYIKIINCVDPSIAVEERQICFSLFLFSKRKLSILAEAVTEWHFLQVSVWAYLKLFIKQNKTKTIGLREK